MSTKEKYYCIIFFIFFFCFLWHNPVQASQRWNKLDYDVTLNDDGSMDVVETWDITINNTNTIYKNFKIDNSKYSSVSNISVKEVSPNEKDYKQIYDYQYHVNSGCFYALEISGGLFQIAWNVGLDSSEATRTYKLSYTVNDAVKVYNDCTDLYWMFLDKTNKIPGDKVTGRVRLPKAVSELNNLKVWGHGPTNAKIERTSRDKVSFECDGLLAESMFEIRIVTKENIYSSSCKKYNQNKLTEIMNEEADYARKTENKLKFMNGLGNCIYVVYIVLIFFVIWKDSKNTKEREIELKKYSKQVENQKYFRDIPDEQSATPARAAYLCFYKGLDTDIKSKFSQIFSATLLDLALKKYIEIEPIDDKDFLIKIKGLEKSKLINNEKMIYEMLVDAAGENNEVSTKELIKYAKNNYKNVNNIKYNIESDVERILKLHNIWDKSCEKEIEKWNKKKPGVVFAGMFIAALLNLIYTAFYDHMLIHVFWWILLIVIFVYKSNINGLIKKLIPLTESGLEQSMQWKGLRNYMKDFSLLKEKEVPDLVLWEKYLVYATTFGISKEVIKQLKLVYPEISNPDFYTSHQNFSYIGLISDSRFGDNFIDSLNSSINRAIVTSSSAYISNEYGGGGSFSSGGGGRTEVEAAVAVVKSSNMF